MPLNKTDLQEAIEVALTVSTDNPERSAAEVAADLAEAIDTFVRGGDVVQVQTSVTSAALRSGLPTLTVRATSMASCRSVLFSGMISVRGVVSR